VEETFDQNHTNIKSQGHQREGPTSPPQQQKVRGRAVKSQTTLSSHKLFSKKPYIQQSTLELMANSTSI
jgi:hypothetical protein